MTTVSGFSQTKIDPSEKKEKIVLQFGLAPTISFTSLSLINKGVDNDLSLSVTSIGNVGNGKYDMSPRFNVGLSPFINISIYKNLNIFTGVSFSNFSYHIDATFVGHVSDHKVEQYQIPIQLSYMLKLGKSNNYLVPKIGFTTAYHSEVITPYRNGGQVYGEGIGGWFVPISRFRYETTFPESSVKKIIPGISGSLAFRQKNIKGGGFEFGIAASYQINPKVTVSGTLFVELSATFCHVFPSSETST